MRLTPEASSSPPAARSAISRSRCNLTIRESIAHYINAARGDLDALAERLRTLEAAMAHADTGALDALLTEYAATSETFEARGGYQPHSSAEVLTGLGLGHVDPARDLASLSGGEKARGGPGRAALAPPRLAASR